MTPEAQRIAIHEARLGKRFVMQRGTFYELHTESCPQPFSCHWESGRGFLVATELPDYLNDLNAMHEAEKTLDVEERAEFNENLFLVCGHLPSQRGNDCLTQKELFSMIHATAAQRAEAFLRAKGLWT